MISTQGEVEMNGGEEFHSRSRSGHLERTSLNYVIRDQAVERGNNHGRNGFSSFARISSLPTEREHPVDHEACGERC